MKRQNFYKDIYKYVIIFVILVGLTVLVGCGSKKATEIEYKPLIGFTRFGDIFVYPIAGIMWLMGKSIAFGSYGVAIILTTIIVRTIAWPIYAKSNDMSLKMQLMQPELEKIQAKYAGKDDQQSKQRMSMEQMQLYKKYGIGLSSCLMPFIQMPIFIGFFNAISRMPATFVLEGSNWLKDVFAENVKLFGVDLTIQITDEIATKSDKIAIYILAGLVGLTQVASILISQLRQKKQKQKSQSNIPEYRRPQQNDQQKQTALMMNIMLYGMAVMMVVLVIRRPAGLGLYWLVGNIYSTLQAQIGAMQSEKRLEKLRKKTNGGM